MKNIAAILVLIAVLTVVWFVWYAPDVDDMALPEPTTEVAVRVGRITRTSLRAYVTAYGLVAPAPAGANPAASSSIAPSVAGVVVAGVLPRAESFPAALTVTSGGFWNHVIALINAHAGDVIGRARDALIIGVLDEENPRR